MKEANELTQLARPIEAALLSRREAAKYLGVKEQTLAVWLCTKRQEIPIVKIGRLVKYRQADLDAFIAKNTYFSN